MITFVTTAKPFLGHSGVIQRNALQSWKLIHPDVEVILFGDEEGASEVCAELGLRHEPHVERHETGFKYLDYIFSRAHQIARYDCLCYSNCDIMLFGDFYEAVRLVLDHEKKFLMIGRRWDTDITEPVDFANPEWAINLRQFARTKGTMQVHEFVDYFVFSKGLFDKIPPLVVGRSFWDWWLVWKALSADASVIDCTPFIFAIHQNHSYGYHPQGKQGTHEDVLALQNIEVGGGRQHLRFTIDSTHELDRFRNIRYRTPYRRRWARLSYTLKRTMEPTKRALTFGVWLPFWHFFLDLTRPLRTHLGLRSANQKKPSQTGTPP
jgi:hypothetical protein